MGRRFIVLNLLLVASQYICYLIVIKSILLVFFGEQYQDALPIIYIMALGASLAGFYQIIDAFMNAHSQGKSVLASSLLMGSLAVLSAVVLIPQFGMEGTIFLNEIEKEAELDEENCELFIKGKFLTPADKVTNYLSTYISLKMASAQAKRSKKVRSVASR